MATSGIKGTPLIQEASTSRPTRSDVVGCSSSSDMEVEAVVEAAAEAMDVDVVAEAPVNLTVPKLANGTRLLPDS